MKTINFLVLAIIIMCLESCYVIQHYTPAQFQAKIQDSWEAYSGGYLRLDIGPDATGQLMFIDGNKHKILPIESIEFHETYFLISFKNFGLIDNEYDHYVIKGQLRGESLVLDVYCMTEVQDTVGKNTLELMTTYHFIRSSTLTEYRNKAHEIITDIEKKTEQDQDD